MIYKYPKLFWVTLIFLSLLALKIIPAAPIVDFLFWIVINGGKALTWVINLNIAGSFKN
jgi:hypothetical protein